MIEDILDKLESDDDNYEYVSIKTEKVKSISRKQKLINDIYKETVELCLKDYIDESDLLLTELLLQIDDVNLKIRKGKSVAHIICNMFNRVESDYYESGCYDALVQFKFLGGNFYQKTDDGLDCFDILKKEELKKILKEIIEYGN